LPTMTAPADTTVARGALSSTISFLLTVVVRLVELQTFLLFCNTNGCGTVTETDGNRRVVGSL
jgi:hypothetical protein